MYRWARQRPKLRLSNHGRPMIVGRSSICARIAVMTERASKTIFSRSCWSILACSAFTLGAGAVVGRRGKHLDGALQQFVFPLSDLLGVHVKALRQRLFTPHCKCAYATLALQAAARLRRSRFIGLLVFMRLSPSIRAETSLIRLSDSWDHF